MILTIQRQGKNRLGSVNFKPDVTRRESDWGRVGIATEGGHRLEIEANRNPDGSYQFTVVRHDTGTMAEELVSYTFPS